MNDAFVGNKDSAESTTNVAREKQSKDKKQPLAITAGGNNAGLGK
jgi:hypothetical protein